jgi:uncharacterized delta-60 repeat protein
MCKISTLLSCNSLVSGLLCLGMSIGVIGTAAAADGDLDPSFAANGSGYLSWATITDFDQSAVAVLAQQDGNIVLVGNLAEIGDGFGGSIVATYQIGVARLLPNGALDPSFGDTVNSPGQMVLAVAGLSSSATAAALTPDGRIVIAGTTQDVSQIVSTPTATVWRLTSVGAVDERFNGTGAVSVGEDDQFNSVLVGDSSNLGENEIVLGGWIYDSGRGHESQFITRLDVGGGIETGYGNATFSGGGNYWVGGVQCPDGASDSQITGLAFNPQYFVGYGSSYLYAAGDCSGSTVTSEATVIAYDSTTVADTTFGDGGLGVFTFGNTIATEPSYTTGMKTSVAPDGALHITIAGYVVESTNTAETHVGVAQVLRTGEFDTNFGFGGHLIVDFGSCCAGDPTDMSTGVALLVQHDGGVVVGVSNLVADGSLRSFALMRLTSAGVRDGTFGHGSPIGGAQAYGLEEFGGAENDSFSVPTAMAFTAGEKIVLAGYIDDGSSLDYYVVARMTNDSIFANGFEGIPIPPPLD